MINDTRYFMKEATIEQMKFLKFLKEHDDNGNLNLSNSSKSLIDGVLKTGHYYAHYKVILNRLRGQFLDIYNGHARHGHIQQ